MRDSTCTPTPSEPEAKIQVPSRMFFLQGTSALFSTPLWLLLSTQESGWRGQVAAGTAGPPQANQGCSTGGKVLGAVLGARECAEPDTTLPVTHGCWPSCPQRPLSQGPPSNPVPLLSNRPGPQWACSLLLQGALPALPQPHVPENTLGPQSPGVTLRLKAPAPIQSTRQDLAAAACFFIFLFFFIRKRWVFSP